MVWPGIKPVNHILCPVQWNLSQPTVSCRTAEGGGAYIILHVFPLQTLVYCETFLLFSSPTEVSVLGEVLLVQQQGTNCDRPELAKDLCMVQANGSVLLADSDWEFLHEVVKLALHDLGELKLKHLDAAGRR